MFGWLISSANAHSVVTADASVPAANISCKIHWDLVGIVRRSPTSAN